MNLKLNFLQFPRAVSAGTTSASPFFPIQKGNGRNLDNLKFMKNLGFIQRALSIATIAASPLFTFKMKVEKFVKLKYLVLATAGVRAAQSLRLRSH